MGKKRDKAAPTDGAVATRTSMRKAARDAAREAIAAESRAIIDLVEAQALEAAAAAGGDADAKAPGKGKGGTDDSPEKPAKAKGKAGKKGKGRKKDKDTKDAASEADSEHPAATSGRADAAHDHDRVDDDDGTVDFRRLTTEIEGLVRLVERHRPEVRRAVFDSYVTAVIEFGATAKDLGLIDVHDRMLGAEDVDADGGESGAEAGDGDLVRDIVTGPRRRSFETPAAAASRGPVREADGLDRSAAAPKRARASVHRGRSGVSPVHAVADSSSADGPTADGPSADVPAADDARRDAGAPSSIRRRRGRTTGAPTLGDLAAADPPRNNDQRNLVIVQSHELAGTSATLDAVRADYERMGWRVPANLRASLRQSIRKGLLLLGDDGDSYRPA
ncbi:hypothetical protein GCM10011490_29130 [Pseudoclavibacter endophyticus]|uniref:Uncharacterized protein n=1 Tax=Pseudoclavibacter endophyticus TaxID=1778590 RepID=A0A6H9WLS7_9MICO|nr:hypothetical protein [Pseudoclavibacter endophyticus]KAB1646680.1 hypothetical protein F8O04_13065 [Pseudoclavibacter endophyticus]GGA76526.1 hypothetical protein GCM10011490_29130 [Pseudoclavibacter endophyticus]